MLVTTLITARWQCILQEDGPSKCDKKYCYLLFCHSWEYGEKGNAIRVLSSGRLKEKAVGKETCYVDY